MTTTENSALGISDLLRIVRSHRGKSILTFILIFSLCLCALYLMPRTYQSELLLFVRIGRESMTLDPTVTTGQTISLNESRESELNSILEVIRSRAMMEKVVDRLGPEAILVTPSDGESTSTSKRFLAGLSGMLGRLADALEPAAPISRREKALQTVTKNTYISNARKSNVVSISYRARSPKQAQCIANAISDEYLLEHRRIHTTQGSYDFFVQQADLFSKRMDSAINAMRKAKNEMELASIEGKRLLVESQIQKLVAAKQISQSVLAASEARINSLQNLIAGLPQRVNIQQVEGMPNVAGDHMRQQLFQLEIKEKGLLSRFTDKHPLVVAVREQLKNASQILEQQTSARVHTTMASNPSLQKLELELLVERAAAESRKAQLNELQHQHQLALADQQEVNHQEQRIKILQREVDLAERSYFAYAEKREQARIQQSLDEQKISNVNITQSATFVEKPISPKKSVVLIAGFFISCLGAICVAIRAELNNPRMRTQEEVEAQLGTPVVVTIPAVARNRVLIN